MEMLTFDDKKTDKFYKDYNMGVNIDDIEFKMFTYDELQEFFKENYYDYDMNQVVFWEDDGFVCPYGMHYLEFGLPCKEFSYILGLVDNAKGGKTIIFCMEYNDNYQIPLEEEKEVCYVLFIETNYFFRRKGIFNRALKYIKERFSGFSVFVISTESDMGIEMGLFNRFVDLFKDTDVLVQKDEYIYSLVKRRK